MENECVCKRVFEKIKKWQTKGINLCVLTCYRWWANHGHFVILCYMLYICYSQFCYYAPETLMYTAPSINGSFCLFSNI